MNISALKTFLDKDERVEVNQVKEEFGSVSIDATIHGPAMDIDEKYNFMIDSDRQGLRLYVQGADECVETKNSISQLEDFLNKVIETGLESDDNKSLQMDDSHKVFINGIEKKIDNSNRKHQKAPLPPPSPTLMDNCSNNTR